MRPEKVYVAPEDFKSNKRRYEARQRQPGKNGRRALDDRPFIAWDGEGWTDHQCPKEEQENCKGGCQHHYYLFGCSAGISVSAQSLGTMECLQAILRAGYENPYAIHIGYAFDYDVNMIVGNLGPKARDRLFGKERTCYWKDFRLEYFPKKWFQVTGEYRGRKITVRIQDIFSYFGMAFVKSLKGWNVGTPEEIEFVSAGKDMRGDFGVGDLDAVVRPYWELEIALCARLGERLRSVLYSAGILNDKWYGPGTIANYLHKTRGTESAMDGGLRASILDASQYAYAGGRFELFRAGFYEGPVYSADINSAYPYAMSLLPSLATGEWEYLNDPDAIMYSLQTCPARLGLFHVEFFYRLPLARGMFHRGVAGPAFYRWENGSVSYPNHAEIWVHLPEYELLKDLNDSGAFHTFTIKEAWLFHDDGSYPFEWVAALYEQRAAWKREGNPAQLAAKLGLNSLYGKLAQRLGGHDGKVPTWHQLEWAGHITSKCRAMLFEGFSSLNLTEGLISVETDGIYSTQPFAALPNGEGSELGQWKVEEYTGILYLQSGVYWLRDGNGEWLPPKSRGIPSKHLEFEAGYRALASEQSLRAEQSQFIGYNLAKMRGGKGWRTWVRNSKEFKFGGDGKRQHNSKFCAACRAGVGFGEGLHNLMPRPARHGLSERHYLPWRDGSVSDMRANLDDLNDAEMSE